MTLWPGYRLGPYVVEDEVARGGQAVVHRARDTRSDETVALKVLLGDLAGDPVLRARLEREAQAVRALSHPSIVAVHEAGELDGHLYIAMQLIDGPSLLDEIRDGGGLDPLRALAILRQLAAALDHAHAREMVHRDIKPANVLIDREDRAYLTDFGLAKVAKSSRLTRTGMWVGTIEYIAPEQLMAQRVGPPADVYALSALAYEALAGRPPFVRQSPAALLQAHLTETPRPASSLRPALAFADPVLAQGLAKEPGDRFPSAGALVEALAAALGAPAQGAPAQAAPAPAEMTATLVLEDGTGLAVSKDMVLGRDPAADELVRSGAAQGVAVPDRTGMMSRCHAFVGPEGGGVVVADRGSANGTYVRSGPDREWVQLGPGERARVPAGGEIRLGAQILGVTGPPPR